MIAGRGTSEARWLASPALVQLEQLDAADLVPTGSRAVIVSPHPDDEVLGIGGLLSQLAALGRRLLVIAVTDGEASHRPSRRSPVARLAARRSRETEQALSLLASDTASVQRLRLPDGRVAGAEAQLVRALCKTLGPSDVLFSTWRSDGHPDHEASARACVQASAALGCRLIEFPVWMWHWAKPETATVPWTRARRFDLDKDAALQKSTALRGFSSQLERRRDAPSTPILPKPVMARFQRPFEVLFV